MKEDINLLPPQILDRRHKRLLWRDADRLIRLLILSVFVCLLVIFSAYVVVVFTDQTIGEATTHQLSGDDQTEKRLKETNLYLASFESRVEQQQLWLPLAAEALNGLPPEIELTEIGLNSKEGGLVMKGVFQKRESVAAYQRYLEGLSWVEKVEAPLSNFTTGDEVSFKFTIIRK
ncbi:MAG: hypothetical protein U1C49_01330 [Candidatus Andersenbacteria bacterium]|nr:hypothetical protein [bacterium]MDZ4225468.1 hypothetical protein [Candidatus Andersenbacteria bacterium]